MSRKSKKKEQVVEQKEEAGSEQAEKQTEKKVEEETSSAPTIEKQKEEARPAQAAEEQVEEGSVKERKFDVGGVRKRLEKGTPLHELLRYLHGADQAPKKLIALVEEAKKVSAAAFAVAKVVEVSKVPSQLQLKCQELSNELIQELSSWRDDVQKLLDEVTQTT